MRQTNKQTMVQTKTELFSDELIEQANFYKALAHPARLQILSFLASRDNCITGDISEELPLGRTTVNQHIKELKKMGLIHGEIEGVKTKYCLSKTNIERLKVLSSNFINTLSCSKTKC